MNRPNLPVSTRRLLVFVAALFIPLVEAEEPAVVALDPVEVVGEQPDYLALSAPATVTDYSGAFLEAAGIATYSDLAPLVPGLFISEQSVANSSFNLRGITTDNGDPRVTQRVSVFQDGILLSNNAGRNVALFDLERVDVVKGPQPAAFGRAAQIGALSLVSNHARNETSASLTAGLGDYNARLASGHVNVPVVTDRLFARVAFTASSADGYVDNLADGSTLQGTDTAAFRGSLRWQPSAQTTADLIVNYQRDTPPGIAFKSMIIPTSAGSTDPFDDAELNRGSALGADRTVLGLTGIVTHHLGEDWKIASTTGWRDTDAEEEFDADGSQFYLLEAGEYTRARQFSQEFRLTYDADERLRTSLGTGVFWEKASQRIPFRTNQQQLYPFLYPRLAAAAAAAGAPPPPAPTPLFLSTLPALYEEGFTNHGETLAADLFGDISYKFTPKLTLGAGLRISHEDRTSGYEAITTSTPTGIPFLTTSDGINSFYAPTDLIETSRSEVSWTGAINASYEITQQHSAYASVSRGRRPPSTTFSQDPSFTINDLDEEIVYNYEVGLKGMLANRRISYDLAVFRYDYNHFQTEQTVSPGVTVATDGGRASGQGFETTLQARANQYVTFFGTYGFTDAEFASRDEDGNPQAFAGNTFRLTSRHTFSLGATFTLPVDAVGTFFITPSWQYRSGHYFEDDNQQNGGTLHQDGYGLVHLRAGYRTSNGRWEVVLWVRNLLDEEYLIDAGNIGGQFGFPTATRGAPRTVGMQVTARF